MNTQKNYIFYALGLFISLFGSSVYTFAIGLYVLNITGSALSFASTLIFGILPIIIFSPFAGVLADRYNKKTLIVSTDFLNGCLFILMFTISSRGQLTLPVIYGMTFLVNLVTTLFDSAMESSKVVLFKKDNIGSINATSQVIRSSAIILAPVLGGLIFAFIDISIFILINGISFIISSILECFIEFPKTHVESIADTSFATSLKGGVHYIQKKSTLHPYIVYFLVLNFIIGLCINVPLPYIITTLLKRPPILLGSIESFFPIGLLVGGLLISKIMKRYSYNLILQTINYALFILLVLVALPGLLEVSTLTNKFLLIYYGTINFFFGLGISFVDVPIITILHQQIEVDYQGRVLSLVMSIVKVIYPIGLGLSGILIYHLNPFLLPFAGSFIVAIFSMYFNRKILSNEEETIA